VGAGCRRQKRILYPEGVSSIQHRVSCGWVVNASDVHARRVHHNGYFEARLRA
jgi:hypothetical protein